MTSRRHFLSTTTATTIGIVLGDRGRRPFSSIDTVSSALDHVLLGCSDLDTGIAFVEQRTGVRAALGGVHPGRGTRNALLSLGPRRYLEIIAPDPQQPAVTQFPGIREMAEPRLVTWATHPGDLDALATRLRHAGVAFEGPTPGSRSRPDGRTLQWRVLALEDDAQGLLPFFIEWGGDTIHPSLDAPAGCELERFGAATPDPVGLSRAARIRGVDLSIERSDRPHLRARITGPQGAFDVTS